MERRCCWSDVVDCSSDEAADCVEEYLADCHDLDCYDTAWTCVLYVTVAEVPSVGCYGDVGMVLSYTSPTCEECSG